MILCFKLYGDALTLGHLLYQLKKHRFSLFVQIGKITVQLAGDMQLCVQCLAVLREIPQMPLTPNVNGAIILRFIFPGEIVVVANQFIIQSAPFDKSRPCTVLSVHRTDGAGLQIPDTSSPTKKANPRRPFLLAEKQGFGFCTLALAACAPHRAASAVAKTRGGASATLLPLRCALQIPTIHMRQIIEAIQWMASIIWRRSRDLNPGDPSQILLP